MQILIEKFSTGIASPEEIRLVEEFYASFESRQGLTEQLDKEEIKTTINRTFSSVKSALNL